MPVMYVKELAALVGITDRRLRQINETLPEDKKLIVRQGGEKKADLATFVQRWAEYKVGNARRVQEYTLEEAKTEHELLKIEKTRIDLKRMSSEVVPVADVVSLAQEIVAGVKNNLLHIAPTIAPLIAKMDDVEDVEDVVDTAVREALEDLSRLQNYHPPVVDAGAFEDEEDEDDREWENE